MDYANTALERSSYQLNNLWEFAISKNQEEDWPLLTYVIDTTLPFLNLTTETRNTGEKTYNGFTPTEGFSMTFRETVEFSTYNYFKEWLNSIFNENEGTFISMPAGTEKFSANDLIHRTGFLSFNTFELDEEKRVEIIIQEIQKELNEPSLTVKEIRNAVFETIRKKDYSAPKVPTLITTKQILSNIFTNLGRQAVNAVAGTANRYANYGRRLTGQATKAQFTLPPPPTRKSYQLLRSPIGYRMDFEKINERPSQNRQQINIGRLAERINKKTFEVREQILKEKQTKIFKYEGLKILGLSEVSLSYDGGEPLQYTVNFTADRILNEEL